MCMLSLHSNRYAAPRHSKYKHSYLVVLALAVVSTSCDNSDRGCRHSDISSVHTVQAVMCTQNSDATCFRSLERLDIYIFSQRLGMGTTGAFNSHPPCSV